MPSAAGRLGTRLWPSALLAGALIVAVSGCPPRESAPAAPRPGTPTPSSHLPRLVDLGADRCIPCKKMAPILEEIRHEYRGALEVEFIDVGKDSSAGKRYGIRLIPTQVFYDASGREVARHEGFLGKEDILSTFSRSGIALRKSAPPPP